MSIVPIGCILWANNEVSKTPSIGPNTTPSFHGTPALKPGTPLFTPMQGAISPSRAPGKDLPPLEDFSLGASKQPSTINYKDSLKKQQYQPGSTPSFGANFP